MKAILIILVCTITACSSTHHMPVNKHARNVQKHKRPACEKRYTNR